MEITKDLIAERRERLLRDQEMVKLKAEADWNAFNGALEDCDYWEEILDRREATSQKNKKMKDQK